MIVDNPDELDALLEPFVTQWFTQHDHVTWRQIITQYPDLEHLPLNSAMAAFDRLALRLHKQTMYQTLRDLMLY